ncbi:MAG: transcriptional regulator, TetR family [Devosia sp.]|nr:transcriptional regulator, TetR family [Devosia sp.]
MLYQDFDRRQTAVMDAALQASETTLESKASVIASSYVECVIRQGREIPGVIAALAGSPELEKIKRDYEAAFLKKCWGVLAPFAGTPTLAPAGMWAMLGAAERLSYAAAAGDITQEQAQAELFETIVAMMSRTGRPGGPD